MLVRFTKKNTDSPTWVQITGQFRTNRHDVVPFEFGGSLKYITPISQGDLLNEDLLPTLSHELKTPLSTIKLYVQTAMNMIKKSDNQTALSLLNKADRQVTEMNSIIQNILDMSAIFAGQSILQSIHFDMNKLIWEVINDCFQQEATHFFRANFEGEQFVFADRSKIKQVLYNLISNAVKYSPEHSEINIQCQTRKNFLEVSISDQGMGISKKNQKKLFNKFFRVTSESVQNIKGYGIGLYIVNEVIRHHKGSVWIESEEGKGATFYFSLPIQ